MTEEVFVETMKAYGEYVKQLAEAARNLQMFMDNNKDVMTMCKCCFGVFATVMSREENSTDMTIAAGVLSMPVQHKAEFKRLVDEQIED